MKASQVSKFNRAFSTLAALMSTLVLAAAAVPLAQHYKTIVYWAADTVVGVSQPGGIGHDVKGLMDVYNATLDSAVIPYTDFYGQQHVGTPLEVTLSELGGSGQKFTMTSNHSFEEHPWFGVCYSTEIWLSGSGDVMQTVTHCDGTPMTTDVPTDAIDAVQNASADQQSQLQQQLDDAGIPVQQ